MELNFKKDENTILVYLQGRFDVFLTEKIEKEIRILIGDEKPCHLILNLRDIEYLSSSGIGLLVTLMSILKKKGKKLVLCEMNTSVRKILELVEMTTLFNICKTEDESYEFLLHE